MRSLLAFRLILGAAQGLILFFLFHAYEHEVWPATNGYFVVPLVLLFALIPLLVIQASGNMRLRTLVIWTAFAAVVVISLGVYDVWRFTLGETGNTPSPQLVMALLAGMFISHALVSSGDADQRIIARYKTYFDVAWKLAVQAGLAAAFVGTFWIILGLGGALFSLIEVGLFTEIISERWFAIPVTAFALAAAIHVSDVRAAIVRGIRTLGLTLLSWLLPLMTVIALLFLAALPFTGLQPLWDTRFAGLLLLVTAATLVVLINAAYQDGDGERSAANLTRYFGRAAAIGLLPIVLLSAYALHLRVGQYGWTVDRIYAGAAIAIAGTYAGGYTVAALWPRQKMKFVEIWNFYSACLILGLIVALFSPIADPMRIAVASQTNRLSDHIVAPEDFDLAFLRWGAGRYGLAALEEIGNAAPREGTVDIRPEARAVLSATERFVYQGQTEAARRMVVRYPEGGEIPQSFLGSPIPIAQFRGCSVGAALARCEVWLIDLNGDDSEEVILGDFWATNVYSMDTEGGWSLMGRIAFPMRCPSIDVVLATGEFQLAPPEPSPWRDIDINGERYRFVPAGDAPDCPE